MVWFVVAVVVSESKGLSILRSCCLWQTLIFPLNFQIQNFFMSAPYGRNWSFLFSSSAVKEWQILLLAAGFFIGVWAVFLYILGHLSKSHTWIFPVRHAGNILFTTQQEAC